MRALRTTILTLLCAATIGWTAPRRVTLSVPGMTCATCPVTIKAALLKVTGVTAVTVRYEEREADVLFDDTRTNTEALIKATAEAGYPSTLKRPRTGASGS